MIWKVSAEDIAIRGNGTGLEYMCPTWHFVYIFFNPVFQVSTAKNEINLFNNHILIVAPVTFAPAGAMTPSAEFLFSQEMQFLWLPVWFPVHQAPSEKGYSLKGKNFLSRRVNPFSEGGKIYFGRPGYIVQSVSSTTVLEVIKLFSCSTQLSMKFSLLIYMKMPTIVGIFIFISRENFMLSYA